VHDCGRAVLRRRVEVPDQEPEGLAREQARVAIYICGHGAGIHRARLFWHPTAS
jgi:hypothetical protein